jgi:hypothetical protein
MAEGTTTVVSVTRTHAADVLYEEKYQPCFIWTLVLAPCFMPFVWYVLPAFEWLKCLC